MMKKLFQVFIMAFALLFVAGCSSSTSSEVKTESKTFVKTIEPGIVSELEYFYQGDKVVKQTTFTIISYEEANITEEAFKQAVEPLAKQYEGVTGLTHKIEYLSDKAIESLAVDYATIDIQQASKIPGFSITDPNAKEVSMKASEEMLKKEGFTEKSK